MYFITKGVIPLSQLSLVIKVFHIKNFEVRDASIFNNHLLAYNSVIFRLTKGAFLSVYTTRYS